MGESRDGIAPAALRGSRLRGRLSALGLSLVGILCLTVVERGVAQTRWQTRWNPPGSTWGNPPEPFRLTVRREMATGTRTARAGAYLLDRGAAPAQSSMGLMPYDAVIVPEQCVGTRRCPLLVWFGDTGPSSGDGPATTANALFDLRPLAERYGIIFLAPRYGEERDHAANLGYLDAVLQYVLRNFAIDPDEIAIAGRDGAWAGAVGINNLDVFSRINTNFHPKGLWAIPDTQPRPQPKQLVEYLYSVDLISVDLSRNPLRDYGLQVTRVIHFLGHEQRMENFAFTAHWLHQSWAYPDPATRPKPPVMITPPELTPRALTQLTTFWTRFLQEPDSIRRVARQAHLREVVVQLGQEQVSAWLTDMAGLAAQYPSVAAALKAAGLTAEQHDAYRLALLGAYVLVDYPVPPAAAPALAKNVEFVLGYEGKGRPDPKQSSARNELDALWRTDMFNRP